MTPRSAQRERDSKSIKTFFIYAGIVLFFIILSLAIKSFFLIKQSRFDQNNQFILSISQKDKIKEIAMFHPSDKSVTLIKLQGEQVTLSSLEKTFGILPDAFVDTQFDLPLSDINDTTRTIAFNYYSLKTNLTIFDAVGLFWVSQKLSLNEIEEKEIVVTKDEEENDNKIEDLFLNDKIFSENVSIQIINASSIPGMGKRFERVLSHLGGNVVAVSSSREEEKVSKIQYFGEDTYTLTELKKLLAFPTEKTDTKSIAVIVIIIGNDIKNSASFK